MFRLVQGCLLFPQRQSPTYEVTGCGHSEEQLGNSCMLNLWQSISRMLLSHMQYGWGEQLCVLLPSWLWSLTEKTLCWPEENKQIEAGKTCATHSRRNSATALKNSSLDAGSGREQLPLHEYCCKLTAFITPFRSYSRCQFPLENNKFVINFPQKKHNRRHRGLYEGHPWSWRNCNDKQVEKVVTMMEATASTWTQLLVNSNSHLRRSAKTLAMSW